MDVCASQNTFFAHYITSLSEFIIKELQCTAITSKLLGVHSTYMKLQILPSSLIAVEKTNFYLSGMFLTFIAASSIFLVQNVKVHYCF